MPNTGIEAGAETEAEMAILGLDIMPVLEVGVRTEHIGGAAGARKEIEVMRNIVEGLRAGGGA